MIDLFVNTFVHFDEIKTVLPARILHNIEFNISASLGGVTYFRYKLLL